MFLLVIQTSYSEDKIFCTFLNCVEFYEDIVDVYRLFYILDTRSSSGRYKMRYFPGLPVHFFNGVIDYQTFLIVMISYFSIFLSWLVLSVS